MGIFKKIGNALGIKSHTVVGKILGTTVHSGGGSAPSPAVTTQHKITELSHSIVAELSDDIVEFDGRVLNDKITLYKQEKKDGFFNELISGIWDNVKDGVEGGVKNAGQTLIDKLTGKFLNSNGTQKAKDSISDYTSSIMETTLAKYIKRNWFYIVLPVIGLMVFAKVLFNGKKRPKRKR